MPFQIESIFTKKDIGVYLLYVFINFIFYLFPLDGLIPGDFIWPMNDYDIKSFIVYLITPLFLFFIIFLLKNKIDIEKKHIYIIISKYIILCIVSWAISYYIFNDYWEDYAYIFFILCFVIIIYNDIKIIVK